MNWEMFSICLKGIFDAWIFRITPGSSAFITLHSSTPCGERESGERDRETERQRDRVESE